VNLIAGRRVATELMQNELNGERLAQELLALLDPDRNRAMRDELRAISGKLGKGGASDRAAQAILEFIS
jgi:lipid A disaccharide synthetase